MKSFLGLGRNLPGHRLLVGTVSFFVAGVGLTLPAVALEAPDILVGLGDSYSSDVGNVLYASASATSECNQSQAAYPLLVAAPDQNVRNAACSGATTAAIDASFKSEPGEVLGNEVSGTDTEEEVDGKPADESTNGSLAQTGASVAAKVALGVGLIGLGLTLTWIRLYLRDSDTI